MRRLLLACLLALLLACPAWGATYYYDSVDGSDSNDGLTYTAPKKSIPTPAAGNTYLFRGDRSFSRSSQWTINVANAALGTYDPATGAQITDGSQQATLDFTSGVGLTAISCGSGATGLNINSLKIVNGTFVHHNGVTYLCKSSHTSRASDEPGVGANWRTYWHKCSVSLTSSSDWADTTSYTTTYTCVRQNNGISGQTFAHITTIGGAGGLEISGAGTSNVTVSHCNAYNSWSTSSSFAGVNVAGTSASHATNVILDDITAEGNGIGVEVQYVDSLSMSNITADYNISGGVYLKGCAYSGNMYADITCDHNGAFGYGTGSGLVIDGCTDQKINRVHTWYNADNGIASANSISTSPSGNRIVQFSSCYNGDILNTTDPSSNGDGVSAHQGSGWIFDCGFISNNYNSGMTHIGGSSGTIRNCTIVYNGYYAGAVSPARYNRGGIATVGATAWIAYNCIIANNNPFELKQDSVTAAAYHGYNNCFYRGGATGYTVDKGSTSTSWATWKTDIADAGGSESSGSMQADPLLYDTTHRLSALSPCIDAGTIIDGVNADIDGLPRPQDKGMDIGCSEYIEGLCPRLYYGGMW